MNNLIRSLLLAAGVVFLALTLTAESLANCGDTWNQRQAERDTWTCNAFSSGSLQKTLYWKISWIDGYDRDVDVIDNGQTKAAGQANATDCVGCWPQFDTPAFDDNGTTAYWYQN